MLTPEARAVHKALRRTLLPRTGYLEGFTGLQQRLLVYILTHTRFNIFDFILCEMEEMITDDRDGETVSLCILGELSVVTHGSRRFRLEGDV